MFPCDFGSFGFMSIPGDFASAVAFGFRRLFGGTFCSVSISLFYMNLRENQVGKFFTGTLGCTQIFRAVKQQFSSNHSTVLRREWHRVSPFGSRFLVSILLRSA